MKAPKSAEVNTHSAMVRFLVKVVKNTNNLETRIERLEKNTKKVSKKVKVMEVQIEQLQQDVINLVASTPELEDTTPPVSKPKTKIKETENEK